MNRIGRRIAVASGNVKRIARVVSQPEIEVGKPTAMETEKPFGRGAEPTFFWGGRAARARVSRKA